MPFKYEIINAQLIEEALFQPPDIKPEFIICKRIFQKIASIVKAGNTIEGV
jgi:hypothetical protein